MSTITENLRFENYSMTSVSSAGACAVADSDGGSNSVDSASEAASADSESFASAFEESELSAGGDRSSALFAGKLHFSSAAIAALASNVAGST